MTGGGAPLLTLLVDDDIAYLEVLKFFLEREAVMECEMATSAKQALEMLSQKEFDAVVSDYLMPEMDGLELLKIIRLQGKDTPFVMLTGRGREDVAIEALNNGADYYIPKGGDPKAQYTELSSMISRAARQRRAERRILDDERFLNRLFESVQDGVIILDKRLVIEKANPTMERLYADSMPLVGKRCYEALRGRNEPCDYCPSRGAMKTGRIDSERVVKLGPNGETEGWLEFFSVPVFDTETGEVERVIEYIRDVTEEENARSAFQSSERKYRAITDMTEEGILAIEPGGRIAFVNPSLAKMLGYDADDLVGTQIRSLVSPDSLETMGSGQLHKFLEDGAKVELNLVRKDGSKARTIVAASPVSSDRGLFDGAVAVVTDISELKTVMEGMISSEERFAKVFQTSPQMIMIARTSDSVILEVNDSFKKATGYTAEQLIGRSYIDLGIVSQPLASRIEQILAERGMVFDMEVTFGTASGAERVVRLSSYRITLQGQECTILISCDLTSGGVGVRELRRERDVLKATLDSTPNGIIITDLDGRVVECNATMRFMLGGVLKENLLGMDVFALLGKEESAKARRMGDKLVREGIIKEMPLRLVREDGIAIRAEVSAAVVKDSLGEPLYFVCVVRDATDQVRYQATLEKALEGRRQMEAIIDDGPAVAFRWLREPGWPVDYVSGNVRSFGYEAADLVSGALTFVSIIHPDDRGRVVEEAERLLSEDKSEYEQEYRIVSPEGEVFWVYDKTKVLRRPNGSVEACQGVVVDVTEMRAALEKLSRTEKQLKLFMDMSPVMKFIKDREGRYVYVNKRLEEVYGTLSGDWIGKTDADIFPPDVVRRFIESDRMALETGQLNSFNEVIPQPDGPHEYLTYKFLVPSTAGGEDLIAGIVIDRTDEKRYERELKAANEKLTLLGNMTRHDIMNQLAVLTGWLDVVREGETNPTKVRRFDGMRKASEAITDLLVFASEYQDIGAERPAWVSVEQAVADGMTGLPLEGVRVDVDVGGLEVYVDPMLERVFRNLLDNSLRHGEKVTRVGLTSRAGDGGLTLVYEDDGVGVSEDAKERIFERGFGKHTGLGLFLARQVLGLTGMTIKETGQEGTGARFEIRAPEGSFRFPSSKD